MKFTRRPAKKVIEAEFIFGSDRSMVTMPQYFDELENTEPDEIVIGVNAAGRLHKEKLRNFPHLLIGGSSRSGKTTFLHTVIRHIMWFKNPEETSLVLLSTEEEAFEEYSGSPHLFYPLARNNEETWETVVALCEEMEARKNRHYRARAPHLIIVADEFWDLQDKLKSKDLISRIVLLAQRARKYNIHLVLATQRPDASTMDPKIKINAVSRISFKVADSTNSQIILGTGGAENLVGNGDMFYLDAKHNRHRLQGLYVNTQNE